MADLPAPTGILAPTRTPPFGCISTSSSGVPYPSTWSWTSSGEGPAPRHHCCCREGCRRRVTTPPWPRETIMQFMVNLLRVHLLFPGGRVGVLRFASRALLVDRGSSPRQRCRCGVTPQGATFEPLISRRARGPFLLLRRAPSKCPFSRSLRRERKIEERKKGDISKQSGTPFLRQSS